MKALNQALFGIIMTFIFTFLVLGSMFNSIWESGALLAYVPQGTPSTSVDLLATLLVSTTGESVLSPSEPWLTLTMTLSLERSPTWTLTSFPTVTAACAPPPGWMQIVVHAGDTLSNLAHIYGTSVEMLIQVNCLVAESLLPGSYLYVPARTPTATPTRTVYVCGAPYGWVTYIIQPGDTLYRLALAFRTTVAQLQLANCMGNSTLLVVGDTLFVPNVPTSTSPPTLSPFPTLTYTPLPSSTPSLTVPPSQTSTLPASPSGTATSTNTLSPSPTMTPIPSPSATDAASPTPTEADTGPS